jgi:hypothetical protein
VIDYYCPVSRYGDDLLASQGRSGSGAGGVWIIAPPNRVMGVVMLALLELAEAR